MHTRNLRCMHDAPQDVLVEAYPEEEFWQDLLKVTGGLTDEAPGAPGDPRLVHLPRLDAQPRRALPAAAVGRAARGAHQRLLHGRRQGAGQCLLPQRRALGVQVRYDAPVDRWNWRTAASSPPTGKRRAHRPPSLRAGRGGFESNRDWLREAWGQNERGEWPADNFLIRGTRFNQGVLLKHLLDDHGADRIGDPTQAHMVAIDARAPLYDGGICTRIDCVSLGVVVNREAERFYDEGEDFWPKRYAIWGRLVAQQPGQIAYDHRRQGHGPLHAAGVPGRAGRHAARWRASWAWTRRSFMQTLNAYNAACRVGTFDHTRWTTATPKAWHPAKTPLGAAHRHRAVLRLRAAPGVTFTYLGLKTDDTPPCASAASPAPTCLWPAR
jgi:tricarballylate dehydrogenase